VFCENCAEHLGSKNPENISASWEEILTKATLTHLEYVILTAFVNKEAHHYYVARTLSLLLTFR
jgi:hypothetical protein